VSDELVAETNEILREKGYKELQLGAYAAPLPGRVLLKGSKILSPFADSADTVLQVVREAVPPAEELGQRMLTPQELRAWLEQPSSAGDPPA
jgi:hypothetical protein